jgi:CBS-domain-containing membrane protein
MKKYESMLLGALGATIGIILLQYLSETANIALLVAPFGATFVLVFALPDSPLVKPKNIIGGYLISAVIGLFFFQLLGNTPISLGMAFGLTFILMQLTKTLHPPAGSIPLLIMFSNSDWSFIITPILAGVILILVYEKFYNFVLKKIKP